MSARSWHLETPFYRSFPSSISLLPLLPPFFPLPPSALPLPLSLFLSFPPSPGALISLPLRARCSLSLGDPSPASLSGHIDLPPGRIDLLSGRINLPSLFGRIDLPLPLPLPLPSTQLPPAPLCLSVSLFLSASASASVSASNSVSLCSFASTHALQHANNGVKLPASIRRLACRAWTTSLSS